MTINYGTKVFVVPAVVSEYLNSATPEQLKVILCLLQSPEKPVNAIAVELQLTPREVENALHFWESKQILQTAEKVNTLPESDMPFAVNLPEEVPKPKRTAPKIVSPKINMSPSEIATEMEKFPDLKNLMDYVADILGRDLNYMEQQNLIIMHQEYEYSAQSIAMTVEYFTKKGKGIAYVKSVLMDWQQKGITSFEQVENEIERLTQLYTFTGQVCKILKVDFDRVSKKHKGFIENWKNAGYSLELIKHAYDKALEKENKLNFDYLNGILKKYAEQGVTTPEEAQQKDEQYRKDHPYTAHSTSKKKAALSPEQTERVNEYLELVNQFEEDDIE